MAEPIQNIPLVPSESPNLQMEEEDGAYPRLAHFIPKPQRLSRTRIHPVTACPRTGTCSLLPRRALRFRAQLIA